MVKDLFNESIRVTYNQTIGIAKNLFVNDMLFIDSSTTINIVALEKIGF